jgi:hypothetical protein
VNFTEFPRVRVPGNTGRDAFFFSDARAWLQRLGDNATSKLVLAVPLYGKRPQPVIFDLNGADVAIAYVAKDCPLVAPKRPVSPSRAGIAARVDLVEADTAPETFCQCRANDYECRIKCAMANGRDNR